ncbi:DNA internalization-related competence protein ComEC/Rec2 [Aquisalimonas asiatica]|uniref:Competence protein ComEC n=1 Tax=Aquisalimonas asiatica TaxID=406100 RepID=A0A1H8QG93_9GAMM|nr:DNA internalization-related competence protein ComEC/Rec2 [Aquisalimonas asiatica]SEO52803.1 competence protein ComEC [Aquisalimonas asiatica]
MSPATALCGAFVAGAIVFHASAGLPDGVGWLSLLAGCALLLRGRPWVVPGLFCAGALWSAWAAAVALDHRLDTPVAVTLEGEVAGLPAAADGPRQSFVLELGRVDGGPAMRRARLHWYGAGERVRPGERWRFEADLRAPAGALNPGAFDGERWQIQNGIDATGTVTRGERLDAASRFSLDAVRAELSGRLRAAVNHEAAGAMLVALAVGDRRFLDESVWATLLATGTNHLVAISGLHVGLAGGLGLVLGMAVWRCCGRMAGRIPARVVGAALALVTAAVYAALAGFTIPTQRALIMLAVTLLAVFLRRPVRPTQVLCVAAAAVLLVDPLAPLDPGFWLSFAAVATLGVMLWGRAPATGPWPWLTIQFRLALVLAPLTLLLFSHVALAAPVANLVAIPLVGLFTVPLVLAAAMTIVPAPAVGAFLADWSGWLLVLFLAFAEQVARVADLVAAPTMGEGGAAWVLLLVAVILALAPAGLPGRVLALPMLAAALWPWGMSADTPVRITTLDVGHGHASVVQSGRHVVAVDTGRTGREVDALLTRIGRPDRLLLTRDRAGYRGGAGAVRTAPRTRVYDAVDSAEECLGSPQWEAEGGVFRVLDADLATTACVLLVEAGPHRVLIAAGVPPGAHVHWEAAGQVDAVVLPAGGHANAVTGAMLDALQPSLAVVSVDAGNRYGLPHAEVVERLQSRGIRLLHTGHDGAITLTLRPGIPVRTAREVAGWWNRRQPFGQGM